MSGPLDIRVVDGVRTITLDRPEVRNAFDDTTIKALTCALEEAGADAATRVVVLTGGGNTFSSGGDLNWMRRMAEFDEDTNRADALALAQLMRTLYELPRPTIARVNGAAFGGAVGLTACCDIAIASDLAKFSLSEVRLGLIPAAIAPYVVLAMGHRQARRLFLTAEVFDARAALEYGLVHQVTTAGALDAAVTKQAAMLLKGGPIALAAAKRMVHRLASVRVDDALMQETADAIATLRVSPEGQEGLTAFLEKRDPDWQD